jgi:hypothetical protein
LRGSVSACSGDNATGDPFAVGSIGLEGTVEQVESDGTRLSLTPIGRPPSRPCSEPLLPSIARSDADLTPRLQLRQDMNEAVLMGSRLRIRGTVDEGAFPIVICFVHFCYWREQSRSFCSYNFNTKVLRDQIFVDMAFACFDRVIARHVK